MRTNRVYYATATIGGCRILLSIEGALYPGRTPGAVQDTEGSPADDTTGGGIGVWRVSQTSSDNQAETGSADFYMSTRSKQPQDPGPQPLADRSPQHKPPGEAS